MKKSKKLLSVFLAALLVLGTAAGAWTLSAKTAGNVTEKNPAWLSGFYVRESSTDFSQKEMIPNTDSAYSRTLGGFRTEVDALKKVCTISLDSLTAKFRDVVQKLYDMISETGLLTEYEEMKSYLETEHGIVYPEDSSLISPAYTAILYACLKYDIISPITGHPVEIPTGTTIDRAIALVVANILGEELPDDVTSLEDYAIESIIKLLEESGYTIPENSTPEQTVLLYKIMIAEQQGYPIENQDVANYTQADIDNLNASYYAAVIKMTYAVSPAPVDAFAAVNSEDHDALPTLILKTMVESKGESTANDATIEQLFDHACKLGFFDLKNGFYSDVYNYDVYLKYNCTEVWLTAYAYASDLGQNELDNVKLHMNGTEITNGKSYRFALTGDVTTVIVTCDYNNGETQSSCEYTFQIHNGTEEMPENPISGGTGGSDMPDFTIPNIDSSGEYSPLPEDAVFNPYDTDSSGSGMKGSLTESGTGNSANQAGAAESSPDTGDGSSGFGWGTALAIVLCVAGGIALGAGGTIGVLAIVKKKTGHIL